MVRSCFAAICLLVLQAQVEAAPLNAKTVSGLAPHRAIYDLTLLDATERSGITSMSGRMVYEFKGSYCLGFDTSFRFITRIGTEGATRINDQQVRTFENLMNRTFDFDTKSFTDNQLEKHITGVARSENDKLKIDLEKPQENKFTFAESRFPTEHIVDILDNAKAGKKVFETRIFDASDDGNEVFLSNTIVGQLEKPKTEKTDAAQIGTLANAPVWPVTIAYFKDNQTGDAVPIYRTSFKLYENGVTRDLVMDYGDFSLSAKLSKLELLPKTQTQCE